MKRVHFNSISEYYQYAGKPAPEHPLFSITETKTHATNDTSCQQQSSAISSDLYLISLKKVTSGEIFYGKTKYDCSSGTMLFMAPNQVFSAQGVTIESTGKTLLIHPDFIRGHKIFERIKSYSFFGYAVNEALHLSPSEELVLEQIVNTIHNEYQQRYDDFSREIILTQLSALLHYAERFYRRQFLLRSESHSSTFQRFASALDILCSDPNHTHMPTITEIAQSMQMSQRYLSDALKVETGKTAKECMQLRLIERSKDLLIGTDQSIATIAYSLGFEYPQYFARLFKKKVGQTPSQYRAAQLQH
ncbi:helix-turn-helix domain-containing protein [Paraglaciecola chathamensis]|uniref:AraC family transcriptional regulator n=1 Tax=Paraglaciecola chathamensis TaxID=368405 RepID=A0A8H9IBI8_9ALTE|nr:AraC family transcriptional regulator [Paraglaciecola oceanifecundans]GGZ71305.1 AraC family transcriptional regulator [Paraglaciecola oceanifecundans]